MDPIDVYRAYCGVKAHFTSPRYDFVEQKGKIKASYSAFENRRDKYFFEKLSRNVHGSQIVPFFVSNFLENPNRWVGDLANAESDAHVVYTEWYRRVTQLQHHIGYDVGNLRKKAEDMRVPFTWLFETIGGRYPPVYTFLCQKMICPETFLFLDQSFHVVLNNDPHHDKDPLWVNRTFILHKYSRFLRHIKWENFDHLLPENLGATG